MRIAATSNNNLPKSARVPVEVLAQVFRNTTNSYKYLFVLSLLKSIAQRAREYNDTLKISFADLKLEMLTTAWYPQVLFRLSFGQQDMVAEAIDSLPSVSIDVERTAGQQQLIRNHLKNADPANQLMNYVPYRLIRPFFAQQTRGLPDQEVNSRIAELCDECPPGTKPLYTFTYDRKAIILDQEWHAYLREHYAIIESWVLWNWLEYMQARNPNTPNIGAKLVPSPARGTLEKERKLWQGCIKSRSNMVSCPYSGMALEAEFALDHVLPWSLVAHNQLWNLVPCSPEVNSSKSASIPDTEYISAIVETQLMFLKDLRQAAPTRLWDRVAGEYVLALRLSSTKDLINESRLTAAYRSVYEPMMELAIAQGFPGNWRYTRSDPIG